MRRNEVKVTLLGLLEGWGASFPLHWGNGAAADGSAE